MKIKFADLEHVESHQEKIKGHRYRVFKASADDFEGNPITCYSAISVDYFGPSPDEHIRYLKTVPRGANLTKYPWVRVPRVIKNTEAALC
jgi:hypothetical protein